MTISNEYSAQYILWNRHTNTYINFNRLLVIFLANKFPIKKIGLDIKTKMKY